MAARGTPRRERLEELLKLAQLYRGWPVRRLAEELGRDPHNLVPDSGVPKIDLVMRLADVLDWPVEMVLEDLCAEGTPEEPSVHRDESARVLNERARNSLYRDQPDEAIRLADEALLAPGSDDDRAYSHLVLASAWDCLGRYTSALEATRRGLLHARVNTPREYWLRANLALYQYLLGNVIEGHGVSSALARTLSSRSDASLSGLLAHARATEGHCLRVMAAASDREPDLSLATLAMQTLLEAADRFERAGDSGVAGREAAQARTARAGAMEMEVLLGIRDAHEAVETILSQVGTSDAAALTTDVAHSNGWLCVFGSTIALRHFEHVNEIDRALAILTTKADEMAARTDSWALRERVFFLEHVHRCRREHGSLEGGLPWTLDAEDLRVLAGTMGRFPGFRATGWAILRAEDGGPGATR